MKKILIVTFLFILLSIVFNKSFILSYIDFLNWNKHYYSYNYKEAIKNYEKIDAVSIGYLKNYMLWNISFKMYLKDNNVNHLKKSKVYYENSIEDKKTINSVKNLTIVEKLLKQIEKNNEKADENNAENEENEKNKENNDNTTEYSNDIIKEKELTKEEIKKMDEYLERIKKEEKSNRELYNSSIREWDIFLEWIDWDKDW